MSERSCMRITPELFEIASALIGVDNDDNELSSLWAQPLYMMLSYISPLEINIKILTEDEMLKEYKNDSDIEVLY